MKLEDLGKNKDNIIATFPSASQEGVVYEVYEWNKVLNCTCPARKLSCWHIREALFIREMERVMGELEYRRVVHIQQGMFEYVIKRINETRKKYKRRNDNGKKQKRYKT